MGDIFNSAYIPDPKQRADRLASPALPSDTADLTGIAPAVVITAEYDLLTNEGVRYADRLRTAGSLVEHHDVTGADHGYDNNDEDRAREVYLRIAGHVRRAVDAKAS
jgi:acetyl esterase